MTKGQHSEAEIEEIRKKIALLSAKNNLDLQGQQQLHQYQQIITEYERTNRLQS